MIVAYLSVLLLALSLLPEASMGCKVHVAAPEKSLREYHPGCDTSKKSRHPDCVSAIHGFCNDFTYFGKKPKNIMGVDQKPGSDTITLSCIKAASYQSVSLVHLKHPGCDHVSKSQSMDCLAAAHRYCTAKHSTSEYAGIVQQISNGRFWIGCFKSSKMESVSVSRLGFAKLPFHYLPVICRVFSVGCFAGIHQWCVDQGHAGGIPQEINGEYVLVACYDAEYSNEAFVKRTIEFDKRSRTAAKICDIQLKTDDGVLDVKRKVLKSEVIDNRKSSTPSTGTFHIEETTTTESGFTTEQSFQISTEISVSFGIPTIGEGGISISTAFTKSQSFTKTDTTEKKFSATSEYNVPPGKGIIKKAIVSQGTATVPYTAKVVTQLGAVKDLEGDWIGVEAYDLRVKQTDLPKLPPKKNNKGKGKRGWGWGWGR